MGKEIPHSRWAPTVSDQHCAWGNAVRRLSQGSETQVRPVQRQRNPQQWPFFPGGLCG